MSPRRCRCLANMPAGLEIRGSNGSKCYHVFSFATGMLMNVVANICYWYFHKFLVCLKCMHCCVMFVLRSVTQPKTTAAALLWKYNFISIFSLRKNVRTILLLQNSFCYLVLHLVAKVCYHKKNEFLGGRPVPGIP